MAPRRPAPTLPPVSVDKAIVQRLVEIHPTFERYGALFSHAFVAVSHLEKLTRDDLVGIGMPLGHAIELRRHLDAERSKNGEASNASDLAHAADAYGEYAVVSALVFGFAVSTFAATPTMLADLESPTSGIIGTFLCLLSGVTLLSAFSTVTAILIRYYCKVLMAREPVALQHFLQQTKHLAVQARRATWFSLSLYLASLCVLAFEIFARYDASAATWRLVLIVSVLSTGALLVLFTYRVLSNAYESSVHRAGGSSAKLRARMTRRIHPSDMPAQPST